MVKGTNERMDCLMMVSYNRHLLRSATKYRNFKGITSALATFNSKERRKGNEQ